MRGWTICGPGLVDVSPGLHALPIIRPRRHRQVTLEEAEEVSKEKVGEVQYLIPITQGGQRAPTKESPKERNRSCLRGSSTENGGRGEQWLLN